MQRVNLHLGKARRAILDDLSEAVRNYCDAMENGNAGAKGLKASRFQLLTRGFEIERGKGGHKANHVMGGRRKRKEKVCLSQKLKGGKQERSGYQSNHKIR